MEINQKMHRALDEIDIDRDLEAAFHCFMLHYAMRENSYFTIETGGAPKNIDVLPWRNLSASRMAAGMRA